MEMMAMASASRDLGNKDVAVEVEAAVPSLSTNMIFSHVMATIASSWVDCIPGNKDEFLSASFQSENVLVYCDLNSNTFCISGSLEDIIICRNKLLDLLPNNKENLHSIDLDSFDKEKGEKRVKQQKEIGINCNLIGPEACDVIEKSKVNDGYVTDVAESFPGSAANDVVDDDATTMNDIDEIIYENTGRQVSGSSYSVRDDLGEKNVNEKTDSDSLDIEEEEEEEKINMPIVSKRGRLIKRPSKLQHSVLSFSKLQEVSDDINNDIEALTTSKVKRKVGRPRKVSTLNKTKRMKTSMISVEEVQRIVEKEKEQERIAKGLSEENKTDINEDNVLQNLFLNKLNEIQEKFGKAEMVSDNKTLESKKNIRKYYEDKMPFKYFCKQCSFKSKRLGHFQNHQNLHLKNPDLKLHKCDMCDFSTVRQSVLQRHHLSHESELIKCHLCSYKTNSSKQLEGHLKKHTKRRPSDVIPHLQCSLCNFQSLSKTKLMNHLQQHVNTSTVDGSPVFQCNECQYKTHRKEHLVRHKNNVHSNRRPYLCDLCGAAFKRIDALAAHKITHVEKSRRKLPYCCVHCKKPFKSRAHLKEHMSVHTNLRSFQCHICGQMFKTRAVQRKHQQCIHYNPRSFKCTTCNKDFNTKYALQRHVRTHEFDSVNQSQLQIQTKLSTPAQLMQGQGDFKFSQGQSQQGHVFDKRQVMQGEETVDENVSAIQTITIASENMDEFTQQLQEVSDHLQSANGIREVYIQGVNTLDTETISIVNVPGQEVQQIFIPAGSETDTMLNSASEIKQMFVAAKAANAGTDTTGNDATDITQLQEVYVSAETDPEYVKHILISSTDDANVNSLSELKEIYVQADTDSEQIKQILIPTSTRTSSDLAQSNQIVLQIENVNSSNLGVKDDILRSTDSDQMIQKGNTVQGLEQMDSGQNLQLPVPGSGHIIEQVVDGQTYQIKLDNGQTLLSLSSNTTQNM